MHSRPKSQMHLYILSHSIATFYVPGMDSLFCTQEEMGTLVWNCCSSTGSVERGQQKRNTELKPVSEIFCAKGI